MKILITGAGGMIAPDLAHRLSQYFSIRLSDVKNLPSHHEYVVADLADTAAVAAAVREVDAVVHLGAITWEQDVLKEMIPSNIVGTFNIFEEARKAGVKKIVFASTHHTVAYHHIDTYSIDEEIAIRPDTFYAVTKVYGEALARLYFERYGIQSYCLRIGYYMTPKRIAEGFNRYKEALILSPDDFAQMVKLCLESNTIQFGIYNCISCARKPWLDIGKAQRELGYAPTGTVENLFGDLPPAKDLTRDDFDWMFGVLDSGPERAK